LAFLQDCGGRRVPFCFPGIRGNTTLGSFTVTASVSGAGTPATFFLTNTVAPAKVQITAGTGQTTPVGVPFATDLAVMVLDAKGEPITGVAVTFSVVPASVGASGWFGGPGPVVVSTDSTGTATAPTLTATGTAGSFKVIATIAGLSTQLTFDLTSI
jgi:hypothetical protein